MTTTPKPATSPAGLFIKPAPGRFIRHPVSMRPLREQGEEVRGYRFYWHRMIQAGDVLVVSKPQKPRG